MSRLLSQKTNNSLENNRLSMNKNNYKYLNEDLIYPLHPEYLDVDMSVYTAFIAYAMSYIDSYEYVLLLNKEELTDIKDKIGKVLYGEITLEELEKSLSFDTSKHENIKKLIKM